MLRSTLRAVVAGVVIVLASCAREAPPPPAARATPASYVPTALFCADGAATAASPLCPTLPGDIGPDPALTITVAYSGILGELPDSQQRDVQSPFDNLSWQTFVALNWKAGAESEPAAQGLAGDGARVWQSWPRVADIFGHGARQGDCGEVPAGLTLFSIASNGAGQPSAHDEEYIQAATGAPLIDVTGNWTVYERRLNEIEVAYLRAPGGDPSRTLVTLDGQKNLIAAGVAVDFPSVADGGATGAIEIKAAWRILDPQDREANQKRFFLVPAFLRVAPDLVTGGESICAPVDMALVGMHVIQKNPVTDNALKPEWFWSTFEHVDNAPLARDACEPRSPQSCGWFANLNCTAELPAAPPAYSFFSTACPSCAVNVEPKAATTGTPYAWSPQPPYAGGYLTDPGGDGVAPIGTQTSRCWQVYELTDDLNEQWRAELGAVGSVFQNYFLVGTQWGAALTNTPDPKVPSDAIPTFLSNAVVETYLQTLYDPKNPFATGSCVSCHTAATLPADNQTSANLSFLPGLAQPGLTRLNSKRGSAKDH